MKQIFQLRTLVAIGIVFGLLVVAPGGIVSPQSASAAACIEAPSTDSQVTSQQACVADYIDTCKASYGDKFCESLTVKDINKCAASGAEKKFVNDCMQDLRGAFNEAEAAATNPQPKQDDCKAPSASALSKDNCGIIAMIILITNVLAGIAGVVIVGAFIWGGILYSMAGSDPNKVAAAKDRIFKAITALLLLIFGFAILQWLVPGGIV